MKLDDETKIKISDFIYELKRLVPFSIKVFPSYLDFIFLKRHDLKGLENWETEWHEIKGFKTKPIIKQAMMA